MEIAKMFTLDYGTNKEIFFHNHSLRIMHYAHQRKSQNFIFSAEYEFSDEGPD